MHQLLYRNARIGPEFARMDEPSTVLAQDSRVVAIVCELGAQRAGEPTDSVGGLLCDRASVMTID
ncbi:hypothetical protein ACWIGI_31955 [Nocardia sp. NPDC055321]